MLLQNPHTKGGAQSAQNLEYLRFYLLHAAAEPSYERRGTECTESWISKNLPTPCCCRTLIRKVGRRVRRILNIWDSTYFTPRILKPWFLLLRCTTWISRTLPIWDQIILLIILGYYHYNYELFCEKCQPQNDGRQVRYLEAHTMCWLNIVRRASEWPFDPRPPLAKSSCE